MKNLQCVVWLFVLIYFLHCWCLDTRGQLHLAHLLSTSKTEHPFKISRHLQHTPLWGLIPRCCLSAVQLHFVCFRLSHSFPRRSTCDHWLKLVLWFKTLQSDLDQMKRWSTLSCGSVLKEPGCDKTPTALMRYLSTTHTHTHSVPHLGPVSRGWSCSASHSIAD